MGHFKRSLTKPPARSAARPRTAIPPSRPGVARTLLAKARAAEGGTSYYGPDAPSGGGGGAPPPGQSSHDTSFGDYAQYWWDNTKGGYRVGSKLVGDIPVLSQVTGAVGAVVGGAWGVVSSLFCKECVYQDTHPPAPAPVPTPPPKVSPEPSSTKYEGTPAEQQQLRDLVEKIRNAGPKGKAFIESLEKGSKNTHLYIATSATKKDGTVIPLSSTGGGITLRPTESKSGDNEVYIDPSNLINYTATDGSTVKETPEGLLLHEMGHAERLNAGDPAQTTGGSTAEGNVRTVTNDIREELGMKPEK